MRFSHLFVDGTSDSLDQPCVEQLHQDRKRLLKDVFIRCLVVYPLLFAQIRLLLFILLHQYNYNLLS